MNNPNARHGFKGTRLEMTGKNMVQRCTNPKNIAYKNYGWRGITVCDQWLHDRKSFFQWAVDSGYSDTLELDRIDNDKGYFPSNCRWVDKHTQNANRRKFNTSNKYIGVWDRGNSKYLAHIKLRGVKKRVHLGTFDTATEAAQVRDNFVIINKLDHTLNFRI